MKWWVLICAGYTRHHQCFQPYHCAHQDGGWVSAGLATLPCVSSARAGGWGSPVCKCSCASAWESVLKDRTFNNKLWQARSAFNPCDLTPLGQENFSFFLFTSDIFPVYGSQVVWVGTLWPHHLLSPLPTVKSGPFHHGGTLRCPLPEV